MLDGSVVPVDCPVTLQTSLDASHCLHHRRKTTLFLVLVSLACFYRSEALVATHSF